MARITISNHKTGGRPANQGPAYNAQGLGVLCADGPV